jgi:hypothetical protein
MFGALSFFPILLSILFYEDLKNRVHLDGWIKKHLDHPTVASQANIFTLTEILRRNSTSLAHLIFGETKVSFHQQISI